MSAKEVLFSPVTFDLLFRSECDLKVHVLNFRYCIPASKKLGAAKQPIFYVLRRLRKTATAYISGLKADKQKMEISL